MAQATKARKAALKNIDAEKAYTIEEAVKLMTENSKVKFDETAEIHFRLGIDPRHADQQIRTQLSLPNGTGKSIKVVVFCNDDKVAEATAAGATKAGGQELVDEVAKGWMDFDVAVAAPDMMRHLAKIARVLGPKGLMPNPKAGTVTPDVAKAVKELVGGRIEIRNDKNGNLHIIFGKISFGIDKLLENVKTLITAVEDAKPSGQKGIYIKNISISSSMGAGIKISTGADEE